MHTQRCPLAACADPREATLLVQQVQNAQGLLFNEVQHILVVHKGDVAPIDSLALVLGLLHLEDVAVEVLLQLLVGQVDAELLEVILLELLKACATWQLSMQLHMRFPMMQAAHQPSQHADKFKDMDHGPCLVPQVRCIVTRHFVWIPAILQVQVAK